jgi:hypothetical protein
MSTVCISLVETSRAELAGERRLALAKQALEDFKAEHDGKVVSPELAWSLAHEKDAVETEVDAAERQVAHCREEIEILELAEGVETDTLAHRVLGLRDEQAEEEQSEHQG